MKYKLKHYHYYSIIQSEFAGISRSDPKLDVHPGQILGAHDVSLEFGLAVGEEVEDSVLLNRESSLDNRHCCCCCIQGRACLHFSVDLEEVSKLDNASGGSTCILHHGLVVDYAGLVERVVHYAGVSVAAQGVVAGGVSVHPIVIQILGGGQGRGEQTEEDQPRNEERHSLTKREHDRISGYQLQSRRIWRVSSK